MFGGLTKTSSRIAIAAALGLTLGGFAFKATPAQAADLGGDCCADLEERVAELEATTVRKGNKKVSVTLSGWVVKSMNYWDDGDEDHFVVGDKDYDLGSRFAITGSATDRARLVGGLQPHRQHLGDGVRHRCQSDQRSGEYRRSRWQHLWQHQPRSTRTFTSRATRCGTLNWGHLSPASDNPAVLADLSGTVIESNGVWFEGPGFFLRPKGGRRGAALPVLTWSDFTALPRPWGWDWRGLLGRGSACGALRLTDLGRLPLRGVLRQEPGLVTGAIDHAR